MKTVTKLDRSNIVFLASYDDSPLIDEYIAKVQNKFDNVGITYTKEPVQRVIDGLTIDLIKISIDIELPSLKHDGWTYLGTVIKMAILDDKEQNIGYENLICSNKSDNDILLKYKDYDTLNCDHCNTKHNRKTVHIFMHEDGREFSVGTSCSKEYFGINVFNQLTKILNLLPRIADFAEEVEERFGYGSRKYRCVDKNTFCKIVYQTIKDTGHYTSRSSIDEFSNKICTTDKSLSIYNAIDKDLRIEQERILKLLKDFDILNLVREYWFQKDEDDIFVHNVQTALKMIEPKYGLIAYAVFKYMDDVEDFMGRHKFGDRLKQSNFIGEKGEKIKGKEVEIYNFNSFETPYGVSFIVSMIDSENNVIVWITSSPQGDKGDKKTIKTAIIKDYKTYRDVKQTIVKNLKFID